jgi:microcompartment protein CcmL/EutN
MHPREIGKRALGFLETRSLARGIVCADAMVKTAPVRLSLLAPVSRGRMLVAIDGEVAPVESALAAGLDRAGDELVDALFLADLHPGVPAALAADGPREVGEALGLVETATAAAAVRAADAALKTADVRLVRLRLARGIGGKGLLELSGPVSMVEAGVAAAAAAVEHREFLLATEIIPSLHGDVRRWCARPLRGDDGPFDPPPEG